MLGSTASAGMPCIPALLLLLLGVAHQGQKETSKRLQLQRVALYLGSTSHRAQVSHPETPLSP